MRIEFHTWTPWHYMSFFLIKSRATRPKGDSFSPLASVSVSSAVLVAPPCTVVLDRTSAGLIIAISLYLIRLLFSALSWLHSHAISSQPSTAKSISSTVCLLWSGDCWPALSDLWFKKKTDIEGVKVGWEDAKIYCKSDVVYRTAIITVVCQYSSSGRRGKEVSSFW